MSVNFNIAMLRSIQQPVAESLEVLIAQLTRFLAGQGSQAEFEQGQHAKLVRGSLEMIGCQAISRLAATLERGYEALSNPERRGWDPERAQDVARNLLLLAEGLDDQIKHMLVDNEDLPVRMWTVWAAVHEAMAEPVPPPEDLFEPDPNFEDEKFQPLATDYLAQVCEGMSERLTNAIALLDAAQDGVAVSRALREAERVFNWAYGLRHRRGYQAYWLVMRARMAMGLIQEPEVLEDKAPWNVLLGEALIELQKFAKDTLRVRPDLLLKVIRPLLTPWPDTWTQAHPALAEMDARMGLSVFWKTVQEVQDQKSQVAVSQFAAHQDELLAVLAAVRGEWTKYISGEERAADLSLARESMASVLRVLVSKKGLFSDPSAIGMIDEIAGVTDPLPLPEAISDAMSVELASAILVVEDSVERRGRFSPEFHEHSLLQQKRLALAWSGRSEELHLLPVVRWDAKKQERQTRQAMSAVFKEVRKDLVAIEESLVERFRGEQEGQMERSAVVDSLSLADAVLRTLQCDSASRVVCAMLERIPSIPPQGAVAQKLQDEITLGITGLTSFLAARESGDEDADNLLVTAVRVLLDEPLHRAKDPSLLNPPPEQDIDASILAPRQDALAQDDSSSVPSSSEEEAQAAPVQEDEQAHLEEGVSPSLHPSFDLHAPGREEQPQELPEEIGEDLVEEQPHADASASGVKEEKLDEMVKVGMWDRPSAKEPELAQFLLDESVAVFQEIDDQALALQADPGNADARASLRRQFHTLKGSGRIAGLVGLAEAAWWVESMLSLDEQNHPQYRQEVDQVVRFAKALFEGWFEELSRSSQIWVEARQLREKIDALRVEDQAQEGVQLDVQEGDEVAVQRPLDAVQVAGLGEIAAEDFELISLDARASLHLLRKGQDDFASSGEVDVESLGRAAHTLASLAGSIEAVSLRRLARSIENAIAFNPEDPPPPSMPVPETFMDGVSALVRSVERIVDEHAYEDVDQGLIERIEQLHRQNSAPQSQEVEFDFSFDEIDERQPALHEEPPAEEKEEEPVVAAPADSFDQARTVADENAGDAHADEIPSLGEVASQVASLGHEMEQAIGQAVEGPSKDELLDEVIDKMSDVADRLQEAIVLLIKLSERTK